MCKLILAYFAVITAASAIFLSAPIQPAYPPLAPPIGTPIGTPIGPHLPPPPPPQFAKGGCPLCDRSVYGYCYDKMRHDACCCNNGNVPFHCPPFDDCSYLHAKSCSEHALIFTCCCNNPYH